MHHSGQPSLLSGMCFIAAMLLTSSLRPATAEFYDGNQLNSWCQLKDKGLINAYVAGVYDNAQGHMRVMEPIRDILNTHAILDQDDEAKNMLKAASEPISGCPAASTTLSQMALGVCAYLIKNPKQRSLGGARLVTASRL